MSGRFEGFTQDDINKVGGRTAKLLTPGVLSARGIRRMPDASVNKAANKAPKGKLQTKPVEKTSNKCELEETTDESMTSLQENLHFRPLSVKNLTNQEAISDESILHIGSNINQNTGVPEQKHYSPFKGVSLKDFESQRKRIEEQNKQKKELLYRAIEQHAQKTAAEIKKIEEIKTELAKLDHELATDVAILRKQIEDACVHFSNIQNQYDKIESQFLKAKIELYNASEKKELLTEHLCTVITHNEDRKAKKLSELMEKVGLTTN